MEDTTPVVEQPGEYWRAPAIAQEYDRGRFHDLWGRVYRSREERAIQHAFRDVPHGSTVVDVACGTGRVTAVLTRAGLRATGCDISLAMMAVARQRLGSLGYEVPLLATDARRLPYPDKSFDAASCVGLLMHLDAEARVGVLRELARVARGQIVVQFGCVAALTRAVTLLTRKPAGNVRHPISEAEMRSDLERTGLGERERFWVLRGFSSSLIVVLTH